MSQTTSSVLLIGALNLIVLLLILMKQNKESGSSGFLGQQRCTENDKKPYIIYNKDSGKYNVQFGEVLEKEKDMTPQGIKYADHVMKIQECLPLLKEMKQNIKKQNKVVKDIPEYVPKFGEMATVIDYEFDKVKFTDMAADDWIDYNPFRKLGLYDVPVADVMYDDIPGQGAEFDTPHMGIFNNPHYCDEHDNFVINNPKALFDKLYYVSDYHQMSLIRMFV